MIERLELVKNVAKLKLPSDSFLKVVVCDAVLVSRNDSKLSELCDDITDGEGELVEGFELVRDKTLLLKVRVDDVPNLLGPNLVAFHVEKKL